MCYSTVDELDYEFRGCVDCAVFFEQYCLWAVFFVWGIDVECCFGVVEMDAGDEGIGVGEDYGCFWS